MSDRKDMKHATRNGARDIDRVALPIGGTFFMHRNCSDSASPLCLSKSGLSEACDG